MAATKAAPQAIRIANIATGPQQRGAEILWRAARWANALSYFISFTTLCANRHKDSLTRAGAARRENDLVI